ncbi:hypothetical protein ACOSP7_019009 [Xanthoceras sorbifolium]|uniref:Uncharacterized protein n=1 Tax=Xanthoceras sorbifolium TaxID=99658 RepID=A0ABQ8I238_9ROSI|nr:hypothetical protein JRO89_XS05G0154800 [Xanthoceras sorbifolium]
MAALKGSSSSALVLAAIIMVVFSAAVSSVSAQELAPAPAPNAGDGYSLGMSGAVICSSLFLSMLALLKH